MPDLIVRRISDREEVDRVALRSAHPHYVEKVMRGLLINMDTEKYFVDDTEAEVEEELE